MGICFLLQISITLCLVTPFKQCWPFEVHTSLLLIIKKFVELHVETYPSGSSISPSSTPILSASIQAAIQLCLLKELTLGSWVKLFLIVLTVPKVIPSNFNSGLGFLYSGIITIVG